MANELTVSSTLKYQKGSRSVSAGKSGIQLDVAGTDHIRASQIVGTSEEALDIGGITTPGYCFVRNLDSANFVRIRPATGVSDLIEVPPGGIALFKFAGNITAPFVIADTGEVEIEYTIIEA
ncbi:MAG: hypothetical protein AAF745_00200 [Planctomycetota bacterium]